MPLYINQHEHSLKLGTFLADIGRQVRFTDEDYSVFQQVRDKSSHKSVSFE